MALSATALVLASFLAFAAASKPEVAAQQAAEKWLTLLDDGKYVESWTDMSAAFKKEVSKRKWKSTISDVRKPLGKVVSRKLNSAEFTKEPPGAPEGEYVVLTFNTDFQNKTNAVETVTSMRGLDLIWRVSSYIVK